MLKTRYIKDHKLYIILRWGLKKKLENIRKKVREKLKKYHKRVNRVVVRVSIKLYDKRQEESRDDEPRENHAPRPSVLIKKFLKLILRNLTGHGALSSFSPVTFTMAMLLHDSLVARRSSSDSRCREQRKWK